MDRGWTCEVHALAAGVDLYRDAQSWTPFLFPEHARAAGEALAELHLAAEGFNAPARRAQLLVSRFGAMSSADPVAQIRSSLPRRPALADYLKHRPWEHDLRQLIAPWHEQLHAARMHLPPAWTHNDWHASNLMWSSSGPDARVTTAVDFGLSDRTTPLYDLATAIERNAIPWLQIQAGESAQAQAAAVEGLLEGYRSRRGLSASDCQALALLLPLVHVEFALSELQYFHGVTKSTANSDLAYDAFLLGHAGWFRGPRGTGITGPNRGVAGARFFADKLESYIMLIRAMDTYSTCGLVSPECAPEQRTENVNTETFSS